VTQPPGDITQRLINHGGILLDHLNDSPDFSRDSIHHTLGINPTQGSPGSHTHLGDNVSKSINQLAAGGNKVTFDGTFIARTPTDWPWFAPALVNGWTEDFAGTIRFRQDIVRRVELRGRLRGGTQADGTTLFTLPAGYRPGTLRIFPETATNNIAGFPQAPARINIDTTGIVNIFGLAGLAANSWVTVEAAFYAEN
jgi:hypothetical protein